MTMSEHHYRNLATICTDVAQVSLASVVVPYFLDTPRPSLAGLGVVVSLTFWFLSFLALNRVP
jgi:hypothetical protein